jgi:ADP-ribose pyrophosphatase YjhB (NUDIX family)
MNPYHIRPIVIGIFKNEDKILVGEYYDSVDTSVFYRPLGGGLKFGECSKECLIREIKEEMGTKIKIKNIRYAGVIENIFWYGGNPGHEIVLVYYADFVEPEIYNTESMVCADDESEFVAVWKPISEFRSNLVLYPEGLLDLLDKNE